MFPLVTLRARLKAITKEHLEKYQEMHEQLIGPDSKVENGGYPDSGTGWYSKDLEYFDQIKFLNA